jgi:hypothetical protein
MPLALVELLALIANNFLLDLHRLAVLVLNFTAHNFRFALECPLSVALVAFLVQHPLPFSLLALFDAFAEYVAVSLAKDMGDVLVACQTPVSNNNQAVKFIVVNSFLQSRS